MKYISDPGEHFAEPKAVFVEEDDFYPQQLCFQSLYPDFGVLYNDHLTSFNLLKDWDKRGEKALQEFEAKLEADGFTVYGLQSALYVVASKQDEKSPLWVRGLGGEGPNSLELFPYQQDGLNKAFRSKQGLFFFSHDTGTGKTILSSAGIQEFMVNRDRVDLVLYFGTRRNKQNLANKVNEITEAIASTNDSEEKKKRIEGYNNPDVQVFALNYAKAHFDYEALRQKVQGKRVLFMLDEVQNVIPKRGGATLNHKALTKLMSVCSESVIWLFTASIIQDSPEHLWHALNFKGNNPLGTLNEFRERYVLHYREVIYNERVADLIPVWDFSKLIEIPYRISPWVHTIRKSDPEVAPYFKDVDFVPVPIEMSRQDRRIYDKLIQKLRKENVDSPKYTMMEYYNTLRYICNSPENLYFTEGKLAQELVLEYQKLTSDHCNKMLTLMEHLSEIQERGEKVVVFTHWTNMSLKSIERQLIKKKIRHVTHDGEMTDSRAQEAQERFKKDPSVTVFLSSDAGAEGLNFQEARYVINYEIPYSYDRLKQRNDRIDRADSYLDGLTTYVYYNLNTVEEKIWVENEQRCRLTEATQGTVEALSRSDKPSRTELQYLLLHR